MKRIFAGLLISLFLISQSYALVEWRNGAGENSILGSESATDIDSVSYNNIVAPLDRLLANYRRGGNIVYLSASTLTVEAGEVVCSNSAGTIRKFRQNTSGTTVTWADIDTGAEASSTTYYIYAVADADATTFTLTISTSSTSPTGKTYYKRLGSFYNDGSSNIDQYKIFNDTNVFDGSVNTLKLKTYYGETSVSGVTPASVTLAGGEYGFYPQIKHSAGGSIRVAISGFGTLGACTACSTSSGYVSNITLSTDNNASGTVYAQQRYVTSSGKDYWIFLLIDKDKKEIISSYNANDHCAYGNSGDFNKIPHPFLQYIDNPLPNNLEIVLVEKKSSQEILSTVPEGQSIAELIVENYYPEMKKIENYVPLHSGRFINQEPELVNEIPGYIRVRKLKRLSESEKQEREKRRKQEQENIEQGRMIKKQKLEELKTRLNITDNDLDILRDGSIK